MSFASPLWLAALALIPLAVSGIDRGASPCETVRGPVPGSVDAATRG